MKAVQRKLVLLVRLKVNGVIDSDDAMQTAARYWGVGGRHKDLFRC